MYFTLTVQPGLPPWSGNMKPPDYFSQPPLWSSCLTQPFPLVASTAPSLWDLAQRSISVYCLFSPLQTWKTCSQSSIVLNFQEKRWLGAQWWHWMTKVMATLWFCYLWNGWFEDEERVCSHLRSVAVVSKQLWCAKTAVRWSRSATEWGQIGNYTQSVCDNPLWSAKIAKLLSSAYTEMLFNFLHSKSRQNLT